MRPDVNKIVNLRYPVRHEAYYIYYQLVKIQPG
jgi:hypothetical protein